MIEHFETELLRCRILHGLDISVVKLDRLAALHADHVVMMLMVVEVFVSCDAVGEIDLSSETGIDKDLHRAIHRCVTDARITGTDHPVNILYTSVPFVFEKCFKDELAGLFLVSHVSVALQAGLPAGGGSASGGNSESPRVTVSRARGTKCERCWNWRETVGKDKRHPTLCHRCVEVLKGV